MQFYKLNLKTVARLRLATAIFICFAAFSQATLKAQSNVSVLSFGAIPDGIMRNDGLMTAGSPTLTSSSGSFSAADVGKYIQVIGAGPGGSSHTDGAMTSGSPTLTSSSGSFAASDIGRGIIVLGAGAGGGNLISSVQGYNSPNSIVLKNAAQTPVSGQPYYYGAMTLESSIQSVVNSTTIKLSNSAFATISSASFSYGTDDHTSFQKAVDSVGQAGGGTVSVPSPGNCPSGAVCGYVVKASDQMTAQAPGAVKIRYNNVSLIGDSPQTNLFCRGAYASYSNSVAFPGTTGYIRGFCLTIGDNGGANGTAGEYVSNITISNLHLYGMTNGNTFNNNFGYPPQAPSGDGWDITHKAIYMWDNGGFSNITIDSVILQDFKAENIYSGGSPITGMVIKNSTITNFNGNGISMLAADLQVLNNTISNGSNAAVENSSVSTGAAALIRQLYQGNTIAQLPREGIVVVGVDNGVASGSVQILNNTFDTIAQVNPSGTESAIYVGYQGTFLPPANVTVSGNICHDCNSFGVFETSGNTLVQGNTFTIDKYNASNFMSFTYAMNGTTISNNDGSATSNASANGLSLGSVYQINPGYASGGFPWKNVVLKGNSWNFSGSPQYQFGTSSGLGWALVSQHNLNWQGDICSGCTHADADHGLVDLSRTSVIEPFGPTVYLTGNNTATTATVDSTKEENGAQLQVVNRGSSPVLFNSDSNLSLPSGLTLAGGGAATFYYNAALGKFTAQAVVQAPTPQPNSISATAGSSQSINVNTSFNVALQALVKDASSNPISGVTVTFTAPSNGASGTFAGALQASAVTGSNGIATAPTFTANGQAGSYTVSASIAGISANASFSLTNTLVTVATNGALAGSGTSSQTSVNLTQEGTVDWEHWGEAAINRKAGVTSQLGVPTVVGSGTVLTYQNDQRPINWTDGNPTIVSNNNGDGIFITGIGQGFTFTAPADTTQRTVIVHVGGWSSGGTLRAHLSDSSAADYVDVTTSVDTQYDRNYMLSYHAGGSGQQLLVSWTMTSGQVYGNVTVNGAALMGSAASLTTMNGNSQSAAINTAFATALQVQALSGTGAPMPGVTITFTAPASGPGALFTGAAKASATTDSHGIATAPSMTANSQLGSYSITASATGFPSDSFALTNIAGPPASIAATGGTVQSTVLGTNFPSALQATVKDSGGNPLSGVSVTFNAPSPGASAAFGGAATLLVPTNANGIATTPIPIANNQTGSYNVTASVAGLSSEAQYALTNLVDPPARITPNSGTPQTATVSSGFASAMQALVTDTNQKPLSGIAVTFLAPGSGPSGNFGGSLSAVVSTNSSGLATAPAFIANSQAGSFVVLANFSGAATSAGFSLTNIAASGTGGSPVSAPNPAAGGSLTGSGNSDNSAINLTQEGAIDWIHWGDGTLNRKGGVVPQISDYQMVDSGIGINYNNDFRQISWTDGTPNLAGFNNADGLYTSSVTGGFTFTAPAATAVHRLVIHVGGWLSAGRLIAHLSDGSAPDYIDVTPLINNQYDRNYTLTYSSASPGQTIQITWVDIARGGNVTLSSAALQ